jgi:UDPglucose--hexose-1-phosphate uridylyltransferase
MSAFSLEEHPHTRLNPLTGEWLLVSPHRATRPWQGQVERGETSALPRHDPSCYLCPGNSRAGGETNPDYRDTFIFTNDFSSLLPETPEGGLDEKGLFVARAEKGICRVICFSPRHDLTVPRMEVPSLRKVIDVWTGEYGELGGREHINHVQIFENKGAMMGCSNPHPHCQIWAQESLPVETAKEQGRQREYLKAHGRTLLGDYLDAELSKNERIVCANDGFVALVPFWAVWPFEAMVICRRAVGSLHALTDAEKTDLADIYRQLTIRYDNLFRISFPYSMGIHQAPTDGKEHPEWRLHMHFYPPLLRSATVRKFMVGYEMMANPQRDITAEQSARRLRELPSKRYTE